MTETRKPADHAADKAPQQPAGPAAAEAQRVGVTNKQDDFADAEDGKARGTHSAGRDKKAAERRDAQNKEAAGTLAQTRQNEDEAIKQRRLEEDQALDDKRTAEDRVLASAGHRLFLAAAAMTAAVNNGDIEQVRGANGELQEAVDAQLALSKPE